MVHNIMFGLLSCTNILCALVQSVPPVPLPLVRSGDSFPREPGRRNAGKIGAGDGVVWGKIGASGSGILIYVYIVYVYVYVYIVYV